MKELVRRGAGGGGWCSSVEGRDVVLCFVARRHNKKKQRRGVWERHMRID